MRTISAAFQKRWSKGFTLAELIVVVTILSILSALGFLALSQHLSSARDSVRATDLANFEKGLEVYAISNGRYPLPLNSYDSTGGTASSIVKRQGNMNGAAIGYTKTAPVDPLTKTQYVYAVS